MAAIGLGVLALRDAAGGVLSRSNPAAILLYDATEPRALTRITDAVVRSRQPPMPTPAELEQLREALHRQPLSSRTLRLIAMADGPDVRQPRDLALLRVAHRVSRRDAGTEILLAQQTARAGDVKSTVAYLDTALSTTRNADATAFPLLTQLVEFPAFRAVLADYLDRPWMVPFLLHAAQNGSADAVLSLALRERSIQQNAAMAQFRAELVTKLVKDGFADLAIDYVRRLPGGRNLDAPGFTARTIDPAFSPISWSLGNANGLYVAGATRGVNVSIDPAAGGAALKRVFPATPGPLGLTVGLEPISATAGVAAEWSVACLDRQGETPIAARDMPIGSAPATWRMAVTVPAQCRAVRISLSVRNTDDQLPAEFAIPSFDLAGSGD